MWIWFAMRGTGIVLLALMTVSTALGVMATARVGTQRWPRFATQTLHRNVSLLTTVLLAVHVTTAVVHEFVDIRWYDIFAPVGGKYVVEHRLGMALASLAFDLTVAVVITSLVRERLSHRAWRIIHLSSYGTWLAGLVHGLLIGTDSSTEWARGVNVVSAAVVAVAVLLRVWTAVHEVRREAVDPVSDLAAS